MKYVLCLVVLAAAVATVLSSTTGQSACRDPIEVGKTYPHHFDHKKYWYCEKLGVAATEMDCPHGTAYLHYLRECIPWENWIWKKPENPPTMVE